MRSFLTLGVLALAGALFAGCGKADCDPEKAMSDAAECGLDADCMQKVAEKYSHCE